jgi:Ca2+-binding EF-hand superfamily protein
MTEHATVLQVSEEKLRALQDVFDHFDADRSGFIDSTELVDLLRALGFNPPDHRVVDIIEEYDTDRNHNQSFGEFIEVWMLYCQEAATEMALLRKAFSFFDYVRPHRMLQTLKLLLMLWYIAHALSA